MNWMLICCSKLCGFETAHDAVKHFLWERSMGYITTPDGFGSN